MKDNPIENFLDILQQINTSLAHLVCIQELRYQLEKKMTLDDSVVQQLIDAINTALTAETTETATIAAQQATIASLTAQLAPNPALLASVQTAIANAAAANPPPVVVVVPPVPVIWDATATYNPGDVVTDAAGAVWTAVTPNVGEAPGVTAANWTVVTPAPAA
jgi:hypothetical protein